jgi:tetratricopeptide (TPR) repeat protein
METIENSSQNIYEIVNSLKLSGDEKMLNLNYKEAIIQYSLALNYELNNFILLNRCVAFLYLGQYEDALADAEMSIKLNPKYARAWSRLGSCLLALDRRGQAKISFKKAYELNPYNENYKNLSIEDEDVEEDDNEMKELMNKVKTLTTDKIQTSYNYSPVQRPSSPVPPLDGMINNIFKKMMNNDKLLKMLDDNDFQNKINNFQNNPLEALKDDQMINLMKDIMNDLN